MSEAIKGIMQFSKLFNKARHKYIQEGITSLSESVWRNILRRTAVGKAAKSVLGEVFTEKLVMAPRVGYWPQIRDPRSFNEKIVHRKLFTRDPRFSRIADKVRVREYVREKVGDDVLNEIYHITDDPETIPFGSLPKSFVIKTGNKGAIIVDNKEEKNVENIKKKCYEALNSQYGVDKGEYWYGEVNPKIICERRIQGVRQNIPVDYKFYCFHGSAEYIQVDIDRFGDHQRNIYTPEWNLLDAELEYPQGPPTNKPKRLNEMTSIAEKLSTEFDFARIDLYESSSEGVVFGEITLAPESGHGRFRPTSMDFKWGQKW